MAAITVITDSNTCLPATLLSQHRIKTLPLMLHFGEQSYRDGIDISTADFYARLESATVFPTTSAPTPEEFVRAFEEAESSGAEAAIVVTLSKRLSAMYAAAQAARDSLDAFPVEIVDSGLATTAQGFVALEAARAVDRGMRYDRAADVARDSVRCTGFAFILNTFTYLQRGGRVPAVAAVLGSSLGICPIVGDKGDGQVGILAAARGRERARARMVDVIRRRIAGKRLRYLVVMHAEAQDQAGRLRDQIASEFDWDECFISELSPVMGAHSGPGALGIAYQTEALEHEEER